MVSILGSSQPNFSGFTLNHQVFWSDNQMEQVKVDHRSKESGCDLKCAFLHKVVHLNHYTGISVHSILIIYYIKKVLSKAVNLVKTLRIIGWCFDGGCLLGEQKHPSSSDNTYLLFFLSSHVLSFTFNQ